jgi:hypothetical protein
MRKQGKSQSKFIINAHQATGVQERTGCSSIFIKKKDWIMDSEGNQGTILCPRKTCMVKLGSYSYQGCRCPTCNQFVSPAFQIFRSRLQEQVFQTQASGTTSGNTGHKVIGGSPSDSYQTASFSQNMHSNSR